MRGSLVRARRASASSAGLQWACISIMVMAFPPRASRQLNLTALTAQSVTPSKSIYGNSCRAGRIRWAGSGSARSGRGDLHIFFFEGAPAGGADGVLALLEGSE